MTNVFLVIGYLFFVPGAYVARGYIADARVAAGAGDVQKVNMYVCDRVRGCLFVVFSTSKGKVLTLFHEDTTAFTSRAPPGDRE